MVCGRLEKSGESSSADTKPPHSILLHSPVHWEDSTAV